MLAGRLAASEWATELLEGAGLTLVTADDVGECLQTIGDRDVDMVAVGVYYAGGHIVHLDGSYGGIGAAPNIAKKNIAMPIEYAIGKVHRFLTDEGVRTS